MGFEEELDSAFKTLKDFIKEEFNKTLKERFAELPWWCLLCGEGGNYTGPRPDQYWFPPEDHVCKPTVFEQANPTKTVDSTLFCIDYGHHGKDRCVFCGVPREKP